MAKTTLMVAAAIVAIVVCFSSLLSFADANLEPLHVEGRVYCDPCRVEFETKNSAPIKGASVKLECRCRENQTIGFTAEGVTDEKGIYRLPVQGDHEDDICEVRLVKSGNPDCAEPFKSIDRARVLLTSNVGVVQPSRYVNPLGFMKKKSDSDCAQVLQSMGFLPIE